jgi:hypothetical protein
MRETSGATSSSFCEIKHCDKLTFLFTKAFSHRSARRLNAGGWDKTVCKVREHARGHLASSKRAARTDRHRRQISAVKITHRNERA